MTGQFLQLLSVAVEVAVKNFYMRKIFPPQVFDMTYQIRERESLPTGAAPVLTTLPPESLPLTIPQPVIL